MTGADSASAHLGPIPEGFVAWLGLAVLLVAARLIGTRA